MKKLLPISTLLLLSLWLSAQVTVTNATFPATGDTLKTAIDILPDGIEITPPGSDYNWDFTALGPNIKSETIFLDASAGSVSGEVPLATHLVIDPNTGAESYFRVTSEEVSFIAANGEDPIGVGISALFRFEPPIIERRAPMSFPANNDSESNLSIAFAWDDLPAFVTDSIPTPITPDSIRVRVNQVRNDFVDAWGKLSIPGGSYDVLREKRTTERDTRLEVLIELPIIGAQWQDVTDLIGGGGLFEGLGQDTIVTYNFFSNDAKEPIAVVTMDDTGEVPQQVEFKDNDIISSTKEPELTSISMAPNPAKEFMNLEIGNVPEGAYRLSVFSMSGMLVLDKKIRANDGIYERLDISHLLPGNHIIQVSDWQGTLVVSEKFTKI